MTGEARAAWFEAYFRQNWSKLCSHPQVSCWVDPDLENYLVARHGEQESLTGERQTVIWDWAQDPSGLLCLLQESARQRGDGYVVVQQLQQGPNPWPELGFLPELRRVISPTRSGRRETGEFEVRPAESKDLFFIANLHTQGSQFYIPAQRKVDSGAVMARNMNLYLGLDLGPGRKMVGYVICDQGKPFGYILYQLGFRMDISGVPAAYLYDLNLRPDQRGKSAAGQLGRHSLAELAERGVEFVMGDISADNQLGYQAATRAGHFVHESTRWGLRLD